MDVIEQNILDLRNANKIYAFVSARSRFGINWLQPWQLRPCIPVNPDCCLLRLRHVERLFLRPTTGNRAIFLLQPVLPTQESAKALDRSRNDKYLPYRSHRQSFARFSVLTFPKCEHEKLETCSAELKRRYIPKCFFFPVHERSGTVE